MKKSICLAVCTALSLLAGTACADDAYATWTSSQLSHGGYGTTTCPVLFKSGFLAIGPTSVFPVNVSVWARSTA
jgi:hypothetical protein